MSNYQQSNLNSQRDLIEMVNHHSGLHKNRSNQNLNNQNYSPSQASGRRGNYGPTDYKQNHSNRKGLPGGGSYQHRQLGKGAQKYIITGADSNVSRGQNP